MSTRAELGSILDVVLLESKGMLSDFDGDKTEIVGNCSVVKVGEHFMRDDEVGLHIN